MKTKKGTGDDDRMSGASSAEKFLSYAGNDTINAGGGNDIVYGGKGNDALNGDAGNDVLYGEEGNDSLWGGAGNDRLYGGVGDDTLVGFEGRDTLYGGDGQDQLHANTGNDVLNGGKGSDKYFVYADAPQITDKNGNESYYILDADTRAWIFDSNGRDALHFDKFEVDDLEFRQEGLDLVIRVDGYKEKTTISSFFAGSKYRIEDLYVSDGHDGLDTFSFSKIKDGAFIGWTHGDDIWV